jgi:acetylornithine deacetylase/succinyl-diaminopimelate desuccinylase-like protein
MFEMRQCKPAIMALSAFTLVIGCTSLEAFASFNHVGAAINPSEQTKYERAGLEATEFLSKYVQIDTTNPPGNEQSGAEYLASVLKNNGIEAEVIPTGEKNRACVYARLRGTGKKKAVVLLNHIDVVPAEAKDWRYPPFGGEIHDGELWGRGSQDMKGMGIAELEAMLLLKRDGTKLDRDIIFLGTPDEEVGGDHGARWVKEHHPEIVKDAEFLLNEGAGIDVDAKGKPIYWGVDVAEKSLLWLKVTATGDAGHASMPLSDSAPNRLVRALNRLVNAPVKLTILPVVQQYFTDIADLAPPELRSAYKNLSTASQDPQQVELLMKDKKKAAMLRNTVSLTVMKSGYKTNVIPAEAYAELDCRLLPDVKPDDFIAEIKTLLADPKLDISILSREYAEPSPVKTELFQAIKDVAATEIPAVPVVPTVVGWFTDTHWFRELGLVGYGFEPFALDEEHLASVHGKNERIPTAEITNGVRRLHKVLVKLAAAQ